MGQGQLGQLKRDIREDAPLSWFVLKRFFAPEKAKSGVCERNRYSKPYSYRTAELNAGLPFRHRTENSFCLILKQIAKVVCHFILAHASSLEGLLLV